MSPKKTTEEEIRDRISYAREKILKEVFLSAMAEIHSLSQDEGKETWFRLSANDAKFAAGSHLSTAKNTAAIMIADCALLGELLTREPWNGK